MKLSLGHIKDSIKRTFRGTQELYRIALMNPHLWVIAHYLEGHISGAELHQHLQKLRPLMKMNCYDVVCLYDQCRASLIANELIKEKSRKEFIYFSREAGDLFYGHREDIRKLKVYVLDEAYMDVIQKVVQDKRDKMTRRNRTLDPIPVIEVELLTSLDGYTKFHSDLFSNIPFIVRKEAVHESKK